MNCKFCGAELMEGKPFCPSCGKSQEELPEEQSQPGIKEGVKATPGKIALAVAAVVVVLALLVSAVIGGMDSSLLAPTPTEAPEQMEATEPEQTVPATVPADGNPDDVTCKGTYTATDEEVIANADTVVATMGGVELTNGQLQVFYWETVYNFLQQYGSYAAFFGLDYTQPLDTQMNADGEMPMTWQQYFLDNALNTWRSYQAVALEAGENGFEIDADLRAYLDSFGTELESSAANGGYDSVEALLKGAVGAGVSAEDYTWFVELCNTGDAYMNFIYDTSVPTEEEVKAYFAEHEAEYAEEGITMDSGVYVDVRHILIQPEGGQTGEDGYPVYTDEAWAAAELKAQEIYQLYQQGDLSEDSFAQLAMEHSTDGSASNGGLYTDVYVGQMVENFNDWCFDETRQVGDHGLIRTQFGYHIMYFSGSRAIWYADAEYDLMNQIVSAFVPAAMEKYPAEIHYDRIKLGLVELQ